jgi:hypothetical protein
MKKWTLMGLVLVVILSSVSLSSAEEMKDMQDKEPEMKKGMMMGKGKMMGQMMMKVMEKSVTATSDGGIVVLAGNHLVKYDKDMNIIKEADVKVDMDAMQKDMEGMMKMCPMMQGDMKGMESESEEMQGTSPEGAKVESSDEHSSHH